MQPTRVGVIVWLKNLKEIKNLEKQGHILYVSKKMKYVVMYVKQSEVKQKIHQLRKLPYVSKVEPSHWHEVSWEYQNQSASQKESKP